MEQNAFTKAVDSAHQSFDSVSSWFNTLTKNIRENVSFNGIRSQHGYASSPKRLEKERRTSAPACSFYQVDTSYMDAGFRYSQNSFRRKYFKPETLLLPSSQASSKDESIKMDRMDLPTNSTVELMNNQPVEECFIVLTKDSLNNIPTPITASSDNCLNLRNDNKRINTGSSNIDVKDSEGNLSNSVKRMQIRNARSCNNENVFLTAVRTNDISVSNPEVQRRCSLLVDELESAIHNFRQRSRTYGSNDQHRSAHKDLRNVDLRSSASSNNTNIYSRKVSICSETRVSTLHFVSKDNDANDAYSDNYSLYVEHVLNSRTDREEHETPIDENASSICSQSNHIISNDQQLPKQSVTGSLKVCVQHFETTKTLRVIVLTASNLTKKEGYIYPRIKIHYGVEKKKSKTVKLPKVKANTLVVFNAAVFFENINEAKIESLILKVRLYQKEGIFKFKKCLGEMVIPVYKYDLSMDTNIKGRLKHKNSQNISNIFDDHDNDDEDIEVISDDRSISAKVVEAVKPGSRHSSTRRRHGTRFSFK